jgi:teichuronic acid biosynthesis glycosyltransferase TuaC
LGVKLKILFVSSGNFKNGIGTVVKNQGESLTQKGISVDYFPIVGKGVRGYFFNIFKLNRYLSTRKYDLVHAHYSLSAFVATLATRLPIVVSLMGSDIHMGLLNRYLIRFCQSFVWKETIVKAKSMLEIVPNSVVIPNGVNFDLFKPNTYSVAKKNLNITDSKHRVVFISDPKRPEKNFSLADKAVKLLDDNNLILTVVSEVPNEKIPDYLNSAKLLILTSLREGSPNVIKEAMACNCPIVSTDVGDVVEVIGETEGCYICSYRPEDVAEKIKLALDYGGKTSGRSKVRQLEQGAIALKIISLYKKVLKEQ